MLQPRMNTDRHGFFEGGAPDVSRQLRAAGPVWVRFIHDSKIMVGRGSAEPRLFPLLFCKGPAPIKVLMV